MTEIALNTIRVEIQSLKLLEESIDKNFEEIVHLIYQSKGKIVLTGVGKSGIIAMKIAATLSSTGTAALYLHAADATHGDLGMVTPEDFCLLISNSGETAELNDILVHTRRFGIVTAVISSSMNSTLMQAADLKLLLTDAPEACTIGMAPTTSTILTMALGDALAVSLMEQRDFKPDDFKVLHPGGNLGLQILTVSQLMRNKNEMAIVKDDLPMSGIVSSMTCYLVAMINALSIEECIRPGCCVLKALHNLKATNQMAGSDLPMIRNQASPFPNERQH